MRMNRSRTVVVRSRDGVSEFEHQMRNVQRGEVAMRIPASIRDAGSLGRSVSFAQLIATWAERSSRLSIRTKIAADRPDSHERFVSRLHGLAGAYFADCIFAADGKTDIRRALLKAASPRILAMSHRRFDKAARGQLAELVFVHNARHQFHSVAYRRRPDIADLKDPQLHGELIVSPHEMNAFLINVLKKLNLSRQDSAPIESLLRDPGIPLGHLLHETFRNTAEHAYLDPKGRIPSKGLRCILVALRPAHLSDLQARTLVSGNHAELESYFKRLRDRFNQSVREHVYLLELSVLDTGPGFADTMPQLAVDDRARVAHCFVDHASSKPGVNSGLGLGRVLALISQLEGFARFRTATTEAFFSSLIPQPAPSPPTPHVTGGLPKVVGTALTIGIPLAL